MNTPYFDYSLSMFSRDSEPSGSLKSLEGSARCSTYNGLSLLSYSFFRFQVLLSLPSYICYSLLFRVLNVLHNSLHSFFIDYGLVFSYTLECSYNTGLSGNKIFLPSCDPKGETRDRPMVAEATSETETEKYVQVLSLTLAYHCPNLHNCV